MNVVEFLSQLNGETEILLSLSIILFSGFILTRMTNTLNMPKVSGYILAGILIGPCCFNFIPESMIDGMSFVSDLALSFIAFGVGKFFKKEVLMRTGKRIIIITLSEALAAGVLVTFCLKFIFDLDWEFALILGAIATATAPASTMMTINQYKAKGEFVDTLLQIVALDDVVCLLAFSIVTAMVNGNAAGGFSAHDLLIPVAYNLLVIVLGIFCGYFLSRLLIPTRSKDNRLILAIAMLLGLSGICAAIDISPLLSCMVFGAVYINLTRDKKLFRQINSFTPPVMSVFFIVSGMNLDLNALKTVGAIGVSYFIIRIVGKYMGTYLSCLFTKTSRQIRNYMGFALIPQAGVAIGLAFLGQRMLPPETGNLMLTIILASSVLYEMVGPVSAKAALVLSGSIPFGKRVEDGEGGEGLPEVESGEGAEEPAEMENGETVEEPADAESGEGAEEPAEMESGEDAEEPADVEDGEDAEEPTDMGNGKPLEAVRHGNTANVLEDASEEEWKRGLEKREDLRIKKDLEENLSDKGETEARAEIEEQDDEEAQWGIAAQKAKEASATPGAETEAEKPGNPERVTGKEACVERKVCVEPELSVDTNTSETAEASDAEASETEKNTAATESSAASAAEEVLESEYGAAAVSGGEKGASDASTGEERAGTGKNEENSISGKNKERRKKKSGKEGRKEDRPDRKEKSAGKKRRQEELAAENDGTPEEKETEQKERPEKDRLEKERPEKNRLEKDRKGEKRKEPGEQETLEQLMDPELTEEPDSEEEEEDHAVLPELREYSRGVEERDVYDIEREVKPQKNKKKKKGKKSDGKVRKE